MITRKTKRIIIPSTYSPKGCGIAVFNTDTVNSAKVNKIENFVFLPIVEELGKYNYPSWVREHFGKEILQSDPASFREAANYIANIYEKGDVLLGQHEFGFWGKDHHYDNAREFTSRLKEKKVPMAFIFHTLLTQQKNPEKYNFTKGILDNIGAGITLGESGLDLLLDEYSLSREKAFYIPHGVPDTIIVETKRELKDEYGLIGKNGIERRTVGQIGLLSRGKRVEDFLRGFALFGKRTGWRDDLIGFAEGETHPGVYEVEREKYRNELIDLARNELNLNTLVLSNGEFEKLKPIMKGNPNVLENYQLVIINKFLPTEELLRGVERQDLMVVTNDDEDQIVSGQIYWYTSRGRVVLATPSPCAKDFHKKGLGRLLKFKNPESVAREIKYFYDHPEEMKQIAGLARKSRDEFAWPNVGGKLLDVLDDVILRTVG